MNAVDFRRYTPTSVSLCHASSYATGTRTIDDHVDELGSVIVELEYRRNESKLRVENILKLHESIDRDHLDSLMEELKVLAARLDGKPVQTLLDQLNDLGFPWRDIARICGVSVPAVRKWRQGASTTDEERQSIALVVAFCEIAAKQYHIMDVAAWLEKPLHTDAPITRIDLMASERFDLILELAREQPVDSDKILDQSDKILDQYDSDWRDRYRSNVEVFTAADGQFGLRLADANK